MVSYVKYVATFAVGFCLGLATVNILSEYTWRNSLLALSCGFEGRVGVWDSDSGNWCVDFSDAYPEQEAFDRIMAAILSAHERPH